MWVSDSVSVLSLSIFKCSLTMAKQKLGTAKTNWAHSATKQQIHEYNTYNNNYSKHLKTKRRRRSKRTTTTTTITGKAKLTTMTTNRIKCKDFALWLHQTTSNTNANASEYWYPVILWMSLLYSHTCTLYTYECLLALTDLCYSHEHKAHVPMRPTKFNNNNKKVKKH